MVEGNALGDAGFKYLGTPYSQMDCQAFVEKCLSDCGCKKDLAGSNAWYREVANNGWIGSPEECVNMLGCVPKGAFLFIQDFDGKEPAKYRGDGLGNASHIGLVTMPRGEGAIHSSSSRGCVAESKFVGKTIKNGGWNKVGLWEQVSYDYGGNPDPQPDPDPEPFLETAIVGNVDPDKRQDVNLRSKPSKLAKLIDRVPCGDVVTVLIPADDWTKVRWKDKVGYMMSRYLIYEDDPGELVSVLIPNVTMDEAESIKQIYPEAEIMKG